MGRYMRKSKAAAEVAVMEFPATPLGVRTRARALAGAEYLELRSRRLEKVPQAKEAAARRCGGRRKAAAAAAPEEEEVEVSFGENVLELEAMERSTRETTPCSLIRDSETITTPGSTTRHSHSKTHCRVHTPICHNIPSSLEMNEFFTATEQMQQQAFMEKYNFDPVNDCPLPGRYEWVKLDC